MIRGSDFAFRQQIQAIFGTAPDGIIADGKIHRFSDQEEHVSPDTGKRKRSGKAGWYVFHGTHGAFGSWREGETHTWHSGDRPSPASPDDQAKAETARIEKDILLNGLRAQAARHANMLVNGSQEVSDHAYSTRKQIGAAPVGDYNSAKVVVVPLTNDGTSVINAQVIHADGSKVFLAGGRVKECFATIGDPEKAKRLLVCEGYATGRSLHLATGTTVICAMNCGNLLPVARRISELWPKAEVLICADNDRDTSGNPGAKHGMDAAKNIKARFTVPVFQNSADATDFNDLHVAEGLEAVRTQIDQAWFSEPLKYSDDDVVDRLLALTAGEYQAQRRWWSDYAGRKLADLDAMVEARRVVAKEAAAPASEDPWPNAVDGDELLSEVRDVITKHISLQTCEAVACSLWVVHSWVYEQARCQTPILNITSATKRCGKTQLLTLLAKLVKSPKASAGISGAAIYRTIELLRPTLLIDECDNTVSKEKVDLLAVLNAGISPDTATVTRCCGEDLAPKDFDTYCAKVLAGIGARIDTLEDRSITITMRRKSKDVVAQRVRLCRPVDLRRKLLRWSKDHAGAIADAYQAASTKLPDALNDRQQDCWEILFAIADHVGGDWPKTARDAAVLICGRLDADASLPEMLLRDLYGYHQDKHLLKVRSKDLVDWLNAQDERPWKDLRKGRGIDQRRLSDMLGTFGIYSKNIKSGTEVFKGYDFEQFTEAFGAYMDSAAVAATERYRATEPDNKGQNMVADKNSDPLPAATVPLPQTTSKHSTSSVVAASSAERGEYVEDTI